MNKEKRGSEQNAKIIIKIHGYNLLEYRIWEEYTRGFVLIFSNDEVHGIYVKGQIKTIT